MVDNMTALVQTFSGTMRLHEYVAYNETTWEQLHEMLKKRPRADTSAARWLPYPFSSILNDLPDIKRMLQGQGDVPAGQLVPLLEMETSLLGLTNPSIDTLTFFEGVPPVPALRERLEQVAMANPWLAGRLRSADGGVVCLWVPEAAAATICFGEEQSTLRPEMAPLDAMGAVSGVRLGLACIDTDEPLFKVRILHTGSGQFALFVSLSHVLGDAATFYKLYKLLEPTASEPVSLNFSRIEGFDIATLRAAFGAEAVAGHTRLPSTKPDAVARTLRSFEAATRAVSRQKQVALKLISMEWVREQKRAEAQAVADAGLEFLSTNDLLSAWYLNHVGVTHGSIACDCRGRVPGVPMKESFRPGNYLCGVVLAPTDFVNPAALRLKIAQSFKDARSLSHPHAVPQELPRNGNGTSIPRIGNVTNWASLYYHLQLPGARHVVHFPIVNSVQDATHGNMYLFRPRPSDLAALIFFKPENDPGNMASDETPFSNWCAGAPIDE